MAAENLSGQAKPERVVLIGANGFIGRAIQSALGEQNIAVLPLTSAALDLTHADAAVRLAELVRASDTIVMLAALTPDKGRDIAAFMKNLTMMQAVCAGLQKSGCAHLVYFSSDAVYDSATSFVTEVTAPSPGTLYGAMHLARELMARSLAGVPLLVLRPTGVYGRGDTHQSYGPNRFMHSAEKDRRISLFGGGEEMRDHVHIDDVARFALRCVMVRATGTLNLVTGRSLPFRDVARLIAQQAGVADIVELPRGDRITHRHYDVTHLIRSFPDFRFMSIEEGIERMRGAGGESTHG